MARAEEFVKRSGGLEDKIIQEEGRRPIVSPLPDRPTEEEVGEHNVTHSPQQPLRADRTKATTMRHPHKRIKKQVPDVEVSLGKVPIISIDFKYPYGKGIDPSLVAVGSESGKV